MPSDLDLLLGQANKRKGNSDLDLLLSKAQPAKKKPKPQPRKPVNIAGDAGISYESIAPVGRWLGNLGESVLDLAVGAVAPAVKISRTMVDNTPVWANNPALGLMGVGAKVLESQLPKRVKEDPRIQHAITPYKSAGEVGQEVKGLLQNVMRVYSTVVQSTPHYKLLAPAVIKQKVEENPEWFASKIPEWQEAIKSGRLGDIAGDVLMAVGAAHGVKGAVKKGKAVAGKLTAKQPTPAPQTEYINYKKKVSVKRTKPLEPVVPKQVEVAKPAPAQEPVVPKDVTPVTVPKATDAQPTPAPAGLENIVQSNTPTWETIKPGQLVWSDGLQKYVTVVRKHAKTREIDVRVGVDLPDKTRPVSDLYWKKPLDASKSADKTPATLPGATEQTATPVMESVVPGATEKTLTPEVKESAKGKEPVEEQVTGVEAKGKEAWEKTRREYEAQGMGLSSDHPIVVRSAEIQQELRNVEKQMRESAPNWKKTHYSDLETRRSTIGAATEFRGYTINDLLRSNKVPRELKDKYRALQEEYNRLGIEADEAIKHENIVKQALSEGKPVPPEVLADYPDIQKPPSQPQPAPGGITTPPEPVKPAVEPASALKTETKQPGVQKDVPPAARPPEVDAAIQRMTERAQRVKEQLKGEQGATGLPDDLMADIRQTVQDLVTIGRYYIEQGMTDANQWRKQMVDQFGQWIIPHLDKAWEAANRPVQKQEPVTDPLRDATGGRVTGIKNAVTDIEQELYGLTEVEREATKTNRDAFDRARAAYEANPSVGRTLTEDVINKPRQLTPDEIHILDIDRARIENDYHNATSPEAQATALAELQRNQQAAAHAKQHASAGFQAFKSMVKEDYSLANVVLQRKAKLGRDLTPDEVAQLKAEVEKYEQLKAEHDSYRTEKEAEIARLQKLVDEKGPIKRTHNPADRGYGATNSLVTREQYAEIEARMNARLAEAGRALKGEQGATPLEFDAQLLADVRDMITFHLEASSKWSYKKLHGYLKAKYPKLDDEMIRQAYGEVTNDKRLERVRKITESALAEVEKAVEEKKAIPKPPQVKLDAETVRLKQQLEQARARLAEMNKKDIPADDAMAKRLETAKKGLQKRLQVLNNQIARKEATAKISPLEYDLEYLDLKKQVAQQKKVLDDIVGPPTPLSHKIRDAVAVSMNAPTGILAAWDDSFIGRQGAAMLAHQPKAWGKGAAASLKALANEQAAWQIDSAIRHDPHFLLAQKSKLEYTPLDPTAPLAAAEEVSMYLRAAERIPVIGKRLRPFDRAYTTAGNVMRHEAFYRMADVMGDSWTPEHYRAYASFLNKLTGRGDLGRFASFQPELGGLFISPRKLAADIQILTTPFTGPPEVRIQAAKTLVRYTAALGTLAYVVNASGKGKVEMNPDSPDFMKLRVGDTRFDLTGGRSQVIRTMWRIGKSALAYSKYGEAKYGERTPSEHAQQFFTNKMSPGIQAGRSLWTGKDFSGQPITPLQVGGQLVTPWNVEDIKDAWKEEGPGMAVVAGVSSFFGVSASTYKDRESSSGRRSRSRSRGRR